MRLPEIDFTRFRSFQHSQNKGFDELAVQLFKRSLPGTTQFYRVADGGGDGGVEAVATLQSSGKAGIQAKYVFKVSALWGQLNKSVVTALKTHGPDLTEYHIFAPCNRGKSSKDWDTRIAQWNQIAYKLGYPKPVKFIWQGESEIHAELIKEANRDLLHYWFGARRFSSDCT